MNKSVESFIWIMSMAASLFVGLMAGLREGSRVAHAKCIPLTTDHEE